MIEDRLTHLIVDGRSPAFVKCIPESHPIGWQSTDVGCMIDEQDGQSFTRSSNCTGKACGIAAVDDEVVVSTFHTVSFMRGVEISQDVQRVNEVRVLNAQPLTFRLQAMVMLL